jgi:hypothetical protein
MTERINLVQGDTLPYINLDLVKSDGSALILSDPSVTVQVLFRAAQETTTLSTINCIKVGDGSTGQVRFNFDNGVLNVEPGAYEGEVVVNFGGGETQTIYDLLKFYVRQR